MKENAKKELFINAINNHGIHLQEAINSGEYEDLLKDKDVRQSLYKWSIAYNKVDILNKLIDDSDLDYASINVLDVAASNDAFEALQILINRIGGAVNQENINCALKENIRLSSEYPTDERKKIFDLLVSIGGDVRNCIFSEE